MPTVPALSAPSSVCWKLMGASVSRLRTSLLPASLVALSVLLLYHVCLLVHVDGFYRVCTSRKAKCECPKKTWISSFKKMFDNFIYLTKVHGVKSVVFLDN